MMPVAMSLRSSRNVRSSSDKLKTTTDAAASGVGRAVPLVSCLTTASPHEDTNRTLDRSSWFTSTTSENANLSVLLSRSKIKDCISGGAVSD